MADESEFPKIDGDILYGSEVNRFAKAGGYIKIGSGLTNLTSGTAIQEAGSVLIPAETLSNPAHLFITFRYFKDPYDAVETGKGGAIVKVSGISTNNLIRLGSGAFQAGASYGNVNILLGSPFEGFIEGYAFTSGIHSFAEWDNKSPGASAVNTLDNLDPGSPIVIFFNVDNVATGSAGFNSYSIQSFRGAY